MLPMRVTVRLPIEAERGLAPAQDERHQACPVRGTVWAKTRWLLPSWHRFEGVVDQVEDNLLQLMSVSIDERQSGREVGAGSDAVILQLSAQRLQDAEYHLVHIDGRCS
jgi:hypothetical protein